MKYVRIERNNKAVWGELKNQTVFLLSDAPYLNGKRTGQSLPLEDSRLLAPCQPSKIVCVGKNYYDHAVEMNEGIPETPIIFIKPSTSVNDPLADIPYPEQTKRLDYEGELAFIVSKTAKNVSRDRARDFILGYTCFNDVTARDIQKGDGQWTRGKGFDGFAPAGPWITDEVNPDDISVLTRLNGKVVQASRTSKLMWDIASLMEFITACMTLLPGDVVATGTPSGIGPMQRGDKVEVEIEGIGTLINQVEEIK